MGRQTAWMIYHFFNSGDNGGILDFRDLSKVQLRTTTLKLSTQKWDEVLSAVTGRLADNKLEALYQMHVEKSEELKYLLQVYAQETTFGGNTYDYCRLKLMSQRHLEMQNLGFFSK